MRAGMSGTHLVRDLEVCPHFRHHVHLLLIDIWRDELPKVFRRRVGVPKSRQDAKSLKFQLFSFC